MAAADVVALPRGMSPPARHDTAGPGARPWYQGLRASLAQAQALRDRLRPAGEVELDPAFRAPADVEPHHLRARDQEPQPGARPGLHAVHGQLTGLAPRDAGVREDRRLQPQAQGELPDVEPPKRQDGNRVLRGADELVLAVQPDAEVRDVVTADAVRATHAVQEVHGH